jgi:hypothetical protein
MGKHRSRRAIAAAGLVALSVGCGTGSSEETNTAARVAIEQDRLQVDLPTDCPADGASKEMDANGRSANPEEELSRAIAEHDLDAQRWHVAESTSDDVRYVGVDEDGTPTVVLSVSRTPFNGRWVTVGIRYCDN